MWPVPGPSVEQTPVSSTPCLLVSANISHSTGQCSDMEEDTRFSYSTADTEYPNVGPYLCRLLCMRTPECQAWTTKGRSKCVLLREETGKHQAADWSLGTKTCGSKYSYLSIFQHRKSFLMKYIPFSRLSKICPPP